MMNALQALGLAEFEWLDNGNVVGVTGADGKLVHSSDDEVYLGNAGTASRFLATACTMVSKVKMLCLRIRCVDVRSPFLR